MAARGLQATAADPNGGPAGQSANDRQEQDERLFTLDEALVHAQQAHRNGHLDLAEKIYLAVLAKRPDDADALHFLGVLMHQRGDSGAGVEMIQRALALAPGSPGIWNNLGNILLEMQRVDEAISAYGRCLELDPGFAETHNNLGTIYRSRNDLTKAEAAYLCAIAAQPDLADAYTNLANLMMAQRRVPEAISHACKAITVTPGHASARKVLGFAYYTLGELEKAAIVYRDWLAEEPDNPIALHHLAACTGQGVPSRAADGYVEKTFDEFAASFDAKLENLGYRAPQLIGSALAAACGAPARRLDVLDAGCGTGLCGPIVREYARELIGVDLSAKMLQAAQQRTVYDQLHKAELTNYLSRHEGKFDVVLSADTLCYFGDLAEVAAAAHGALRPGGWLLFTVEAATQGDERSYYLQPNGRYVHHRDYLVTTLADVGFVLTDAVQHVLRSERGEPVRGLLVSAQRPLAGDSVDPLCTGDS